MKNVSGLLQLVMVASVAMSAVAPAAYASNSTSAAAPVAKMDVEIHDIVITKLESALREAKEDETVSLRPVRARLADLYADRARLRAMAEAEKNCENCTGALEDRNRALKLYSVVLSEAKKEDRGSLLLQMAQLHELNRENKAAEGIYEKIIREGRSLHAKSVLAEAYIGRAETRFGNGMVDQAQRDFESALQLVEAGRKGPIMHRIAWCELNKGNQTKAVRSLVHILQTPELLSRESSNGRSFDESFQEDVARDLATFLARGEVTHREIALLESLTPDRAKKDTMKHFAGECERLAQRKAAIDAWAEVAKYEEKNTDRLEAMVRVAQIRYDLDQKKEALVGLQNAMAFWAKSGCDDQAECENLKIRVRGMVIAWNKMEKKKPTGLLVDAYLAYLSNFSDDMEMTQWAAEAARAQKRYAQAAVLYHKSSLLAAQSKDKNAKTILENAVVGEVEMAELSKDNRTREASYDHYLQLNPNGAIHAKIRYQRAHVAYERSDMVEASNRFHEFATSVDCTGTSKKENSELCVQAADLDLDALVGLKNHVAVQARANEYAHLYPSRHQEYAKISRTAVLKQAEVAEPTAALAKLNEADLTGASVEDRVKVLKIRIAIAEKARDLDETRNASQILLKTKGLSAQDKEFAMGKIAWAAEMAMDFNEAYSVSRQMKLANLRADERAMKLALLAELSGHDPRQHEEEFLKTSHDSLQKAYIRAKLVRSSRNPAREIAKHERDLKSYPAIYAQLALEIYAKTADASFANRALHVRGVAKDGAGQVLARELFLREFSRIDQTVSRHRLYGSSDAVMKRSLTDRLKMIGQVEKATNQAIASRDWVLQLTTLTALSRENKRIYNDIVHLPVPKKLKGAQRETYVRLVENNARNYMHKADQIDKKLTLLWGDHESENQLTSTYQSARPELRGLLGSEIRKLSQIAPSALGRELQDELKNAPSVPSEQQVQVARREAKQQPFSTSTLAKLRQLEDSRGRETMVAYLDMRMLKLKSGAKQ